MENDCKTSMDEIRRHTGTLNAYTQLYHELDFAVYGERFNDWWHGVNEKNPDFRITPLEAVKCIEEQKTILGMRSISDNMRKAVRARLRAYKKRLYAPKEILLDGDTFDAAVLNMLDFDVKDSRSQALQTLREIMWDDDNARAEIEQSDDMEIFLLNPFGRKGFIHVIPDELYVVATNHFRSLRTSTTLKNTSRNNEKDLNAGIRRGHIRNERAIEIREITRRTIYSSDAEELADLLGIEHTPELENEVQTHTAIEHK